MSIFIVALFGVSVFLQTYIYFKMRKYNPELTENIFGAKSFFGAFFTADKESNLASLRFYYYPLNYKQVEPWDIKLALVINFMIAVYLTYYVFIMLTF
ncbi:hypothetical protein LP316_05980 [Thalassotalea sp. LPB0316]|uniref:hypothetical protein n=1 Tax=Thalassotalea sp. LPB0316 TaxID=2769490 RepID=UPI001867542B|nr:hypothetical protein [Thalassotalea sp. LPB0316]QOL26842.1 hypothetical protein LP316_05980 [Thalassotalea sp. LPB0316]